MPSLKLLVPSTCTHTHTHTNTLSQGPSGVIVAQAKNSYVVSTFDVGMLPAVCAEATEKLAEYLREKGK